MTAAHSFPDLERYGPPRLSLELADVCNLHCRYCLRDEDALYGKPAHFFSLDLFKRLLPEAREAIGAGHITFTGGEPTLHPQFAEFLTVAQSENFKTSFVTNGWNFEKIWPAILSARDSISHVAFSLDGISAAAHDEWRGNGSFVRLVKAFARCHRGNLPFVIKVGLRRDTVDQLEQIAMFSARVGASSLNFGHLLSTSAELEDESALSQEERTRAEQEIASLARIFRMRIGIDVGYYNLDPAAPCSPLAGRSCNIDYRGRLTLCCNLSGFRGAIGENDIAADLNQQHFSTAYARLSEIADAQRQRRVAELARWGELNAKPDLQIGSPCLFCLNTLVKTPWQPALASSRSLPVIPALV